MIYIYTYIHIYIIYIYIYTVYIYIIVMVKGLAPSRVLISQPDLIIEKMVRFSRATGKRPPNLRISTSRLRFQCFGQLRCQWGGGHRCLQLGGSHTAGHVAGDVLGVVGISYIKKGKMVKLSKMMTV